MYKNIKRFEGLSSLRFFAAFIVMLFHGEAMKKALGKVSYFDYFFFHNETPVVFFFVLSGFLITYLLLKEKSTTQRIDIKRFYIRRVLRVSPLYFLMVGIGFSFILLLQYNGVPVQPPFEMWKGLLLYLLYLPFMVNVLYPGPHPMEHLWTVGVEEVFYVLWCPLVKFFSNHLASIFATIIAIKWAVQCVYGYWLHDAVADRLIYVLQFDALATGGLAAIYLFRRETSIERLWVFSKPVQALLLSLLVLRMTVHESASAWSPVYAALFDKPVISTMSLLFLFAWLILNTGVNRNSILPLRSVTLEKLGNVTYGFYVFHPMLLLLLIFFVTPRLEALHRPVLSLIVFYLIATPLISAIAFLSKRYFEDKVLKLRSKWAPDIDQGRRPVAASSMVCDGADPGIAASIAATNPQ